MEHEQAIPCIKYNILSIRIRHILRHWCADMTPSKYIKSLLKVEQSCHILTQGKGNLREVQQLEQEEE